MQKRAAIPKKNGNTAHRMQPLNYPTDTREEKTRKLDTTVRLESEDPSHRRDHSKHDPGRRPEPRLEMNDDHRRWRRNWLNCGALKIRSDRRNAPVKVRGEVVFRVGRLSHSSRRCNRPDLILPRKEPLSIRTRCLAPLNKAGTDPAAARSTISCPCPGAHDSEGAESSPRAFP